MKELKILIKRWYVVFEEILVKITMESWLFVARNKQGDIIIIETWALLVTKQLGWLLWAPLEKFFFRKGKQRRNERKDGADTE